MRKETGEQKVGTVQGGAVYLFITITATTMKSVDRENVLGFLQREIAIEEETSACCMSWCHTSTVA